MDSRIADVLVWCIWSSNFEVRNWSNWTDCAADCEFIIAVVDLRWLHATAESSDTGLAKSKRSPDVPGLPKSTSTMYKKNQMGKALEMKKILEKWKAVGNPWAEHYVNTVNVSRCLNLPHFQVAYHLHRRHPPGLLQTSRRSLQGSGIFIGDFLRNLAFCILLSQIVRWFQAVWQIWDFKFSTLRELWASDNVKTKKTILNLRIQSDQTSLRPPNTVLWQRTSRVLRGCDFSPVILDPNGFKISIAQIILSHGFIQWYADMPHGSWNSWYHRKASQHSRENTNRLVWMLMSLSSMSWSCHSIVPELSNPSQILHLNFNVRMSLPWPLHLAMSGKGKTVKGENNQVTRRNFWISQLTWRILLRNVSNVLCKNLRSLLCCVKLGCLWTGFTIIARLTNTLAKETIHNFQWLRRNNQICLDASLHIHWLFHPGWSLITSMPTSVTFLGGSVLLSASFQLSHSLWSAILRSAFHMFRFLLCHHHNQWNPPVHQIGNIWKTGDRIDCVRHAVPESILDMTPSKLAQTSPNCTGKSPGGKQWRIESHLSQSTQDSPLGHIFHEYNYLVDVCGRSFIISSSHHLSQKNSASEALLPHLLEHSPGG